MMKFNKTTIDFFLILHLFIFKHFVYIFFNHVRAGVRHLRGFINYTIHGNVGSYLDVIRAATRIQISVPHSCVQPAAAMANQAGPALPAFVYRISTADEWAELQRAGATLGGDLDRSTGCIHLSDISQVSPNPNTA
jgi:hypothetical protein